MSQDAWPAFLLASLVTAFTPGQAVLLAISNSLAHGARRALLGALGNAAGIVVLAALAAGGAGALLRTEPMLFTVLRSAGGLYLVYLGCLPWLPGRSAAPPGQAPVPAAGTRIVRQAFLVALGNPKGILFFTALFPQFVRADRPLAGQFLGLSATFVACTMLAHLVYVLCARRAQAWATPGRLLRFRRGVGVLFMVLGLGMLLPATGA